MQGNEYERKYKQLNMLGKGNYGKVYKVKLNDGKEGKEAKYYVAKKMFLEGLSEDQVRSAFGEIEILEKINKEINSSEIPFVVKYEEFFRIQNELIIIMECCQAGDLSTFLKNLKKNGEIINEKLIAFWFIQLLFGIRALHSKNILHRDLKSANIFLTKTYSLKIGDFGISKVLERSSAITCIGTPLYLSPEVCNNQPYGLSSDMWALGCIIYEMCALKYPFEGPNMIVLAKRIVMDDVAPIPSHYSKELNEIIMQMFVKDNKKRITAEQIIKKPYIMRAIQDFVKEQGNLQELAKPIKLNAISEKKPEESSEDTEDTMRTIKSVVERTGGSNTLQFSQSLTAKERMKLKKQEQIRQKQELMKEAARKQFAQNNFARQQKQRNLGQTGQFGNATQSKTLQIKAQNQNKARSQIKYKAKEMEKMQTINITMISNTLKNLTIKDHHQDDFEEVPLPGNSSYLPINEAKTIKKSSSNNDKTIKKESTLRKQQEIVQEIYQEQELEEYYDDDFEDYLEESQTEIQKKQENILAYFQNQLGSSTLSPSKRQKVNIAYRPLGASSIRDKIKHLQDQSEGLVGAKRFAELVKLFKEGKVDMQRDKNKYSDKEKKVLFNIEEIVEFSLRE